MNRSVDFRRNQNGQNGYNTKEKVKHNIHEESVLENALGSQRATFIVNPEWLSESVHQMPSPRRRHPPWSYEYPGAVQRKTQNQLALGCVGSKASACGRKTLQAVERQMKESLKQLTPRV